MHYDILTEGIDLPNITGILPLRELNKVKFLQTAGRAARIFHGDRETLSKDIKLRTFIESEGKVCASKALAKPVFWIIQSPLLNDNALETNQNLIDIVRESYEVEPMFRDVPPTSTTSTPEEADDVLDPIYRTDREARHAEFVHEFESMYFEELAPDLQMECIDSQLDLIESGVVELKVQEINEEQMAVEDIIDDIDRKLDMIENGELNPEDF
jgi:superfamily II DNA or RNA helicase